MKTFSKTYIRSATPMMAISFFALGCAAIGGSARAAQVEPLKTSQVVAHEQWALTEVVGFSDLDVSKIQGAKLLYARLTYAASALCESAATWGKKEGQACINKAIDDAVTRINRPLLSHYHQLHTKGDKAALVQLAKAN